MIAAAHVLTQSPYSLKDRTPDLRIIELWNETAAAKK
jgi:hypothetical protein